MAALGFHGLWCKANRHMGTGTTLSTEKMCKYITTVYIYIYINIYIHIYHVYVPLALMYVARMHIKFGARICATTMLISWTLRHGDECTRQWTGSSLVQVFCSIASQHLNNWWLLGTILSEIWIQMQHFAVEKMHKKMCAKWWSSGAHFIKKG